MKLYMVYNGYVGDCPVCLLVVADSEERAIELATPEFILRSGKCGKNYYLDISAELIFKDLNQENKKWVYE